MLQKERVMNLYLKHKSKRKVAQILKVSRQYIIQVVKDYQEKCEHLNAGDTLNSSICETCGLEDTYNPDEEN